MNRRSLLKATAGTIGLSTLGVASASSDSGSTYLLAFVTEEDSRSLKYNFTADGPVEFTKAPYDSPSGKSIEGGTWSGVDYIEENNGTWAAGGGTGEGYGDAYLVDGAVLEVSIPEGMWIELNGQKVSETELAEQTAPDSHLVAFITEESGRALKYDFTADGPIEFTKAPYDSPAGKSIEGGTWSGVDYIEEDNGTWSAGGGTGEGYGDAYLVEGGVLDVSTPEGMWIELDGQEVSGTELVEQTAPEDTSTDSGSAADIVIPFDGESSLDKFAKQYRTEQLSFADGSRARMDTSLETGIDKGDHYGASMRYRFAEEGFEEPDTLYYRYYLYFPTDFEVINNGGKLPGPAGTYDTAGWGGRKPDGTDGWSARMAFDPGSDSDHVQIGWYCYHPDMGSWGSRWDWTNQNRGDITKGEWHQIDGQVTMNTPGEYDGVLRGWINGGLAHEKTDVRFRDTDDLHVQEFWFNVYYGGSWTAPSDSAIYFDKLQFGYDSLL